MGRILTAALLAGIAAGIFLTAIQKLDLLPLIMEAETYEAGASQDVSSAWAPADGAERLFYTTLANVITAVGFALLLSAAFALRGGIDWRRGVLWGLAGFVTFNLAPALGLPPELPGAEAAPLHERQLWWLITVALTGVGLALVAFAPRAALKGLGVILIAAPHIAGAPAPEVHGGLAPAELEQSFITGSLLVNGVFWVVLGTLTAFLFDRFGRKPALGEPNALG